jgi:glycosyltransferase involved in cell wall biosynthesis
MGGVNGVVLIPVSAIIPTANRAAVLGRTLHSLYEQSCLPAEIIIVDASPDDSTIKMLTEFENHKPGVSYIKAEAKGAAVQRITGIKSAKQETIFFMDDDLLFEPQCVERIWKGFDFAPNVGAVNAMITNQKYSAPGRFTRLMFFLMSGENKKSFAGRVIGPAWNLLPEDRDDLPAYVECDWLNSGCTMYKVEAMPYPVFDEFFQGYSMLEDLSLSLRIGRAHTLLNARTARVFHDSQPGSHKDNLVELSAMELTNRHYVMTKVMNRNSFKDHAKLAIFEAFSLLSCFQSIQAVRQFPAIFLGKLRAIVSSRQQS